MEIEKIHPQTVTKPIQLLAAWLVGLVSTNGSFLFAASALGKGWMSGALVIAAILNVPLFLSALFLLQTKFRPELQEDSFYAEYISKKNPNPKLIDKNAEQEIRIARIEERISTIPAISRPRMEGNPQYNWKRWRVAVNNLHPRYEDIRAALREANVTVSAIFGNKLGIPPNWAISLSTDLPIEYKLYLLKILIQFDFDRLDLWEPIREADETEDVYIGSYGDSSFPITDRLKELISGNSDPVDLENYFQTIGEDL